MSTMLGPVPVTKPVPPRLAAYAQHMYMVVRMAKYSGSAGSEHLQDILKTFIGTCQIGGWFIMVHIMLILEIISSLDEIFWGIFHSITLKCRMRFD